MFLSRGRLLSIAKVEREIYPEGCYVVYIGSEKEHSLLKPGLKGVVRFIDDEANIYVDWENGLRVGLLYSQDYWVRVPMENIKK